MQPQPRVLPPTSLEVLTPAPPREVVALDSDFTDPAPSPELLSRVVEHYHRTFCERKDAQGYLAKRGLTDADLLRAVKVGYADGSLLKTLPRSGELRDQLVRLGVVTAEGRELPGRLCRRPDPGPALRPVDEPLRPRPADARATATSRARCAVS